MTWLALIGWLAIVAFLGYVLFGTIVGFLMNFGFGPKASELLILTGIAVVVLVLLGVAVYYAPFTITVAWAI